jgi:hypothetical protein
MSKVSFEVKVITLIFKDGSVATFEHCISCYKNGDYVDVFFSVTDEKGVMYEKYNLCEVATVINGYADVLSEFMN